MGRPVFYSTGVQDVKDVQTIAGLNVLGMVAKKVAEYDAPLLFPTVWPLVMATGREIVKEAYASAGRPESYNENNIYYTSSEQFAYVAAVNGVMVREKPATCIYMGAFFAESLVLAEVGNSIGAIQIAGTAMPSQLPFFVVACDYTLIGEELFAASAYLSDDPKEIGSLKGQDLTKLIAMVAIGAGSIFATLAILSDWNIFKVVTSFMMKLFTI